MIPQVQCWVRLSPSSMIDVLAQLCYSHQLEHYCHGNVCVCVVGGWSTYRQSQDQHSAALTPPSFYTTSTRCAPWGRGRKSLRWASGSQAFRWELRFIVSLREQTGSASVLSSLFSTFLREKRSPCWCWRTTAPDCNVTTGSAGEVGGSAHTDGYEGPNWDGWTPLEIHSELPPLLCAITADGKHANLLRERVTFNNNGITTMSSTAAEENLQCMCM